MLVLSILLYFTVGCLCVYAFKKFQKNPIPGGFIAGCAVGSIGAWVGGLIPMGPQLAGIYVVPCIAVAAVFIFIATYVGKTIEFNRGA
ncbi:MAG: hypothetical protein K2X77_33010 [Candidatus Obscuribacterales bacterium]|jgi:uncharacterized membrane protein YeaQ/YmgE (transglycosylase-associated protein family)|nr:hypothetical protein [Candidatus Obscuribacterales bacterium]